MEYIGFLLVMLCHSAHCYVMPYHVESCHVTSCHDMSCNFMSCHVTPWHGMSCHFMTCPVMVCLLLFTSCDNFLVVLLHHVVRKLHVESCQCGSSLDIADVQGKSKRWRSLALTNKRNKQKGQKRRKFED